MATVQETRDSSTTTATCIQNDTTAAITTVAATATANNHHDNEISASLLSSSNDSTFHAQFPGQTFPASASFETMFQNHYYSPQLHLLYNTDKNSDEDKKDDDPDHMNVLRRRVAAAMNPLGDSCPLLPHLPPPPRPKSLYDDDDANDDDASEDSDDDDDDGLYSLKFYYETADRDDDLPGKVQILEPGHEDVILHRVQAGHDYYNNVVLNDERYEKVREQCYNDQEYCTYWAAVHGMCDAESQHRDYMVWHCPIACASCHELHVELKCPVDPHAQQAFRKMGDLNRMFERIEFAATNDDDAILAAYEPLVLSRPSYAHGDDKYSAKYEIGPWIIVLEHFLSDEEADHLVQLGHDRGYERSTDTGELDETGEAEKLVTEDRTSTNTFCQDECRNDTIVVQVMERMSYLTGIPARFSEDIQLLRYEPGQFYNIHHDFIEFEVDRMEGPRILTIFMYLNDVEEGGATSFDYFAPNNLTITPKRGRVVIWPSVLDKNPNLPDYRTTHEALPVIKGLKYGANAWIHLRDYMLPREMGC
jgi:prolyl 4-hydroxylase